MEIFLMRLDIVFVSRETILGFVVRKRCQYTRGDGVLKIGEAVGMTGGGGLLYYMGKK